MAGNHHTFFFSSSGYFQYESVAPSSRHHLRCQAPKPETSSNMVRNPLSLTSNWSSELSCSWMLPSSGEVYATCKQDTAQTFNLHYLLLTISYALQLHLKHSTSLFYFCIHIFIMPYITCYFIYFQWALRIKNANKTYCMLQNISKIKTYLKS